VVQTEFQDFGSSGIISFVISNFFFSCGQESSLLFLLGFGGVFFAEFEDVLGLVSVDDIIELIQSWGNFESFHKDSFLSLVEDIFGPSNESGHVSLVLNVTTNSEVSSSSFEQWVLNSLDNFFFIISLVSFLNLIKLKKALK